MCSVGLIVMSRYRLLPTPDQEVGLLEHARHARHVWNLAVGQHQHWRPGRPSAPGHDLARRFDLIRVENLRVRAMTRSAKGTVDQPGRRVRLKAGLNRSILANVWGLLVSRLEDKASGRVEQVNPAYTSLTCSVCGHCAPENRESQARFRCVACGCRVNADVNAAGTVAAGRAVTARGALQPQGGALNREPQLDTSFAG